MTKETVQLDPLSMSEDELSRLDITQYIEQPEAAETTQSEETTETVEETEQEQETEESEGNSESETEESQEAEETETEQTQETTEESNTPDKAEGKTDPESQNVPDHKAFYDSIIGKPIKANGREIIIQNPEDVVQLMQMGANYHEKMAALKPSRRLLKMLESNDLLSEDQLGFLIDLHKKDPKAIAKLVQDSQIDLVDFDPEQGSDYKSQHVAPSEDALNLEDTIKDLSSNPGFKDVLTNVTQTWDLESQNLIAQRPELLRVLNTAKEKGHFDLISAELERERVLGRLTGSTLQAYAAIEQRLTSEGKLGTPATIPAQTVPPVNMQAPKKDPVLAKKSAAAPRQTVQGKKTISEDVNLFALSDEEFAKIDPSQFK